MSTKRWKRHSPEQIVRKLGDADAMPNAPKDLAAVPQALEISEPTYAASGNAVAGNSKSAGGSGSPSGIGVGMSSGLFGTGCQG